MKKLYKHPLKYELALAFVNGSLENANLLSIELLKFIKSNSGVFYTLLPDDADISRLNQFDSFILKQNPVLELGNGEKKSKYQTIPTIRDELCEFLMERVCVNNKLACIFDDFNSTYKEGYVSDLFSHCGIHYNAEVYYLVDSSFISKEVLLKCLRRSNTFWHSVCVLSEVSKQDVVYEENKFNLNTAQKICSKMQLAMFGAYDGEGYVFWEKA